MSYDFHPTPERHLRTNLFMLRKCADAIEHFVHIVIEQPNEDLIAFKGKLIALDESLDPPSAEIEILDAVKHATSREIKQSGDIFSALVEAREASDPSETGSEFCERNFALLRSLPDSPPSLTTPLPEYVGTLQCFALNQALGLSVHTRRT